MAKLQLFKTKKRVLPGEEESSVKAFCPVDGNEPFRGGRVTGVAFRFVQLPVFLKIFGFSLDFSSNGREVIGNYSGSGVYLFDVNETLPNNSPDLKIETESNPTFKKKYVGHCNVRTFKEVNFLGKKSEYITSGFFLNDIYLKTSMQN